MLVGREHLLAHLMAVAGAAVAGRGGVQWILGDAGVGKTVLLDAFVDQVVDDPSTRLLRAHGREGEAELGWAGLHQLLAPLVADGYDDALPAPQRAAVRAALALDTADTVGSDLAPVVGATTLLAGAAQEQPLTVVDDAHWLDQPSLSALHFVASRVDGNPIALVVAGRPTEGREPPCAPLVLDPLARDQARLLLEALGVSDGQVAARIVEQVGGTPLLLEAAVEALDADQRAGRAPLPEVLAVPPSVGRLADERLARLAPETRLAVLAAATAPGGDLAVIDAALRTLGIGAVAIEPPELAGIVDVSDSTVTFSHPTLRSSAYHGASARDRRRAHGAVGAALADEVANAWHLGRATLGTDSAVAKKLSASATTLLHRHTPVEAARHLERAAQLTPDRAAAAVLLRRAADAMAQTGRAVGALDLLDRADTLGGDPTEAVRREQLRLRLGSRGGAGDVASDRLQALAAQVADDDPSLAAELWLDTLPELVRAIRLDDIEQAAKEAIVHADRAGDARLARRGSVVLGGVQLARGDPGGAELLDAYAEVLAIEGAVPAGTFLAEVVAPSLGMLSRATEAAALLDSLERDLREAGAIPALIVVLAASAVYLHGKDLRRTIELDLEAIELADAIDQPELALHAAGSLAVAAAVAGDRADCALAVARCAASAHDAHPLAGLCGRAVLHLGLGELDEALAAYDEMYERFGVGTYVIRWEPEWCEALVRARRRGEAAEILDELGATPSGLLAFAGMERVRGLLADDEDTAAVHFQGALSFYDIFPNDVARGRTELLWGERLRRARRQAEARVHLEAARLLLRGVGADLWADRADRELVLAGSPPSGAASVEALTEQEREIARLAVAGASNREIAGRTFLSPRTVETHLSAVYRKLGALSVRVR